MMSNDNIPKYYLNKIKECKDKQLETLDLSYSSNSDQEHPLTKIPEEVVELKHIKILNLKNNRISKLPESLSNLANLTKLNLEGNQLSSLPESFENLTSLTELNLSENPLENPPIDSPFAYF